MVGKQSISSQLVSQHLPSVLSKDRGSLSGSLNVPRDDEWLEGGVQSSHSANLMYLQINEIFHLSLAIALQTGWQLLTQATLPKQVFNFLLFSFRVIHIKSAYNTDYIYTAQGSTLQRDPLGSPRELHWNCFGIQATNLPGTKMLPGYHCYVCSFCCHFVVKNKV